MGCNTRVTSRDLVCRAAFAGFSRAWRPPARSNGPGGVPGCSKKGELGGPNWVTSPGSTPVTRHSRSGSIPVWSAKKDPAPRYRRRYFMSKERRKLHVTSLLWLELSRCHVLYLKNFPSA